MEINLFDYEFYISFMKSIRDMYVEAKSIIKTLSEEVDELNEGKENFENVKKELNGLKKLVPKIINFWQEMLNYINKKIVNSKNSIKKKYEANISKIGFKDFAQVSTNDIANQVVDAMKLREFCYILCSPCRKKERLVGDIKLDLEDHEIKYVVINTTRSGVYFDKEESWYKNMINRINYELQLQYSELEWWSNENIDPKDIFIKYIEENVLNNSFIDNISIIINGLDIDLDQLGGKKYFLFKEKFYNTIIQFYTNRTEKNNYKKINFILIGETVDNSSYQYNNSQDLLIAWRVNLDNFFQPKIKIFTTLVPECFQDKIDVKKILQEIWKWTNGHPIQTQEISQKIFKEKEKIIAGKEAKFIERIIDEYNL